MTSTLTCVYGPCHLDIVGKTLFTEITNGKLISVRQKVFDATLCAVIFQMVHHMCTVSFHLFAAGHCTKYDFSETL